MKLVLIDAWHGHIAQLVLLPGKQEQAGENHWSWYGLGSCCTCLDCGLPQDRIPEPPDFFWLAHAIIILVLVVCVYTQLRGSAELCSSLYFKYDGTLIADEV